MKNIFILGSAVNLTLGMGAGYYEMRPDCVMPRYDGGDGW